MGLAGTLLWNLKKGDFVFKRIDHVEIVPLEMERSLRFYTEVLGFSIRRRDTIDRGSLREVVYLELGDSLLELLDITDAAAGPLDTYQAGYRMMALEVEDMDAAVHYLRRQGHEVTWGPVETEDYIRAEIEDPDGFPIELRTWR